MTLPLPSHRWPSFASATSTGFHRGWERISCHRNYCCCHSPNLVRLSHVDCRDCAGCHCPSIGSYCAVDWLDCLVTMPASLADPLSYDRVLYCLFPPNYHHSMVSISCHLIQLQFRPAYIDLFGRKFISHLQKMIKKKIYLMDKTKRSVVEIYCFCFFFFEFLSLITYHISLIHSKIHYLCFLWMPFIQCDSCIHDLRLAFLFKQNNRVQMCTIYLC